MCLKIVWHGRRCCSDVALLVFITAALLKFHWTCTIIFLSSHEMLLPSYSGETIKLFTRTFQDDFCPVHERQEDIRLKYIFIWTPAVSIRHLNFFVTYKYKSFCFSETAECVSYFCKATWYRPTYFSGQLQADLDISTKILRISGVI
jgi:hypothetical protein